MITTDANIPFAVQFDDMPCAVIIGKDGGVLGLRTITGTIKNPRSDLATYVEYAIAPYSDLSRKHRYLEEHILPVISWNNRVLMNTWTILYEPNTGYFCTEAHGYIKFVPRGGVLPYPTRKHIDYYRSVLSRPESKDVPQICNLLTYQDDIDACIYRNDVMHYFHPQADCKGAVCVLPEQLYFGDIRSHTCEQLVFPEKMTNLTFNGSYRLRELRMPAQITGNLNMRIYQTQVTEIKANISGIYSSQVSLTCNPRLQFFSAVMPKAPNQPNYYRQIYSFVENPELRTINLDISKHHKCVIITVARSPLLENINIYTDAPQDKLAVHLNFADGERAFMEDKVRIIPKKWG